MKTVVTKLAHDLFCVVLKHGIINLAMKKSHGTKISADSAGSKRFHFKWLHVIFDDACPTSSGYHDMCRTLNVFNIQLAYISSASWPFPMACTPLVVTKYCWFMY